MRKLLHRFPRLLRTHHFKLGVIAAALATLSLFVSLTAYLTTTDTYSPTFRTATGEEFGLSITGSYYNPLLDDQDPLTVTPGSTITLSPTVANNGSIPMSVFAEISTDGLELDELSSDWKALAGVDNVYYYGTESDVGEFNPNATSTIFDDLRVPVDARVNESFSPSVVAYGIQAEISTSDPADVWQKLVGSMEDGN